MTKKMTKNGDKATVREVYQLVNQTKDEIMAEIKDLKKSFQSFEEGRLTTLELDYAKFKTRVTTIGLTLLFLLGILEFALNYFKP